MHICQSIVKLEVCSISSSASTECTCFVKVFWYLNMLLYKIFVTKEEIKGYRVVRTLKGMSLLWWLCLAYSPATVIDR